RTRVALRARSLPLAETVMLDAWLMDLSERAHQETVRAATQEIAATMQRVFGQRIVAFMSGVEDPKAVGRWARGERTPRDDTEQRLRAAFQIAQLLTLADSAETARAWFIGMNPHFADRAPFAILGEDPAKASQVLAAAKAFIVNG
ncbi:MAG: hypothetical protein ACRERD_06600, partial [Candidatus Binatia bacterium]